MTALADRVRVATIRRRLVAISVRHRRAGLESPCAHRLVRDVVRGIARERGVAVRRKDALTLAPLGAILLAVRATSSIWKSTALQHRLPIPLLK